MGKKAGGVGGTAGRGGRGGVTVIPAPLPPLPNPVLVPRPKPRRRVVTPTPAPVATAPQTIPAPSAASQTNSTHPNAAAASKLVEYALKREGAITKDVVDIAAANGGHLEGLASRVKTVDSVARKLADVVGTVPASTSGRDVGSYINDGLRYTITVPEANYVAVTQKAITDLQQKGFSISHKKNYWKSGNTYKGLNLDTNRNGLRIEIQFHTPDSYNLKQKSLDSLYQKYRTETDPNTRAQLKQQMITASAAINIPNNVGTLGNPMQNIR